MTTFKAAAAAVAAGALFALGCGGGGKVDPVKRVKVSGTVKMDGKDVPSGKITFDAQNGQPPGDLDILDGKYDGLAPVGKCKVVINSLMKMSMKEKLRKEGKKDMDGPGYDAMTEFNLLPDRYNTKSEIVREVTEPGPHTFDFADMKSK